MIECHQCFVDTGLSWTMAIGILLDIEHGACCQIQSVIFTCLCKCILSVGMHIIAVVIDSHTIGWFLEWVTLHEVFLL